MADTNFDYDPNWKPDAPKASAPNFDYDPDWKEPSKPAPVEGGFVTGHLRDAGLSLLQGAIGVPEAAVGLTDIATGGQAGKFLENEGGSFGFRPKQAREFLDTLKTDTTQQQKKAFEQADGIAGKTAYALQNPSLVANAVVESAPMMGFGGVIGRGVIAAAPKVGAAMAGAVGEGVAAAGSSAEKIRQETADGTLTVGQSGLAAAAGVATAGFGALGAKVAQRLGIADADTLMVQGAKGLTGQAAQQAAVKGIPRKVIEGAIAEGFLEELPQSVSEQVLQNIALNKDWSEGVDSAVVLGVLSGMAMGGGAAGLQGASQSRAAAGVSQETPAAETPLLALPAPTYTGTPSDQILQAEAERANAVAQAEARAAGIYQQRAEFDAARQGEPAAPVANPGLELVRQAYAAQLDAIQQQEQGDPAVAQSTPPDGRAVLDAHAAQAQADREAALAASRGMTSPDDEIFQSTGAMEPPHRALGIDPAAGPLSAGAAIAVDSGVHGQMQAAAQNQAGGLTDAANQSAPAPTQPAIAAGPAAQWAAMSPQEKDAVASQLGLPPVIARNIPRAEWQNLNADLQNRLSGAMAPAASGGSPGGGRAGGGNAGASTSPGASSGAGWRTFSPDSGTAGVPRAQMPQIKAEHRGAMTNFMNARGVSHTTEEVPASSLRPTQAEFSPAKVRKAAGFTGGDRSILVSSDNYVLDGHHQWLAKREAGEPVKVIRLNAPIKDLIGLAREFPSSTTSPASEISAAESEGRRVAGAADDLRAMSQDAGWSERGGQLIRDTAGNAIGRTKWLPRADWFMAGMEADPATLARDVDRMASGQKVPAKSRRTIEGMMDWLDAQRTGRMLDEDASAYDFEAAGLGVDVSDDALLIGDIFAEMAPQDDAATMRALGFTEEEIQDATGQQTDRAGQGGAGQDGAGRAQKAGAVAQGDARAQGETGGAGLESYTAADLAARDEARQSAEDARAKAEKAADDKARADAERDTFTLTGSDRAADVQAAQGQGGLFDAPAAPNQNPIKAEARANAGPDAAAAPAGQESIKKAPGLDAAVRILMDRTDGNGSPDGLTGPESADARTAIVSALTGERAEDIEAAPNFKFRTSVPQVERLLYDAAGIPAGNLSARRGPFLDWLDTRDGQQAQESAAPAQPPEASQPTPAAETEVPAQPTEATSAALESLFSDLNSDSARKANKARKAAAKLPQAERIDYVQANFHDLLMQMMEAGALEVNGATTLTEENQSCL